MITEYKKLANFRLHKDLLPASKASKSHIHKIHSSHIKTAPKFWRLKYSLTQYIKNKTRMNNNKNMLIYAT